MKRTLIFVICLIGIFQAPQAYKLHSGAGLYFCEGANTTGQGNIWLDGHGRGFYWDNKKVGGEGGFPLKIFPALGADAGLLPFCDIGISSDLVSYGFQMPGNVKTRLRVTLPNNRKLRLWGLAGSIQYIRNFVDEYASFGYRDDYVGFYAEGVMYTGNAMAFRLNADLEFIKWKSWLPLKYYLNIGKKMHLNRDYADYDMHLFGTGIEYKGLTTDFFVEFFMEALNTPGGRRIVDWQGDDRRFPLYFSENPMYLSPGVRIKYPNGITLFAAVPIKVSVDVGPVLKPMTDEANRKYAEDYPQCNEGYSPWYADWKLVGKMSFPIRFKMTNYEMIRKFMLLKNRGDKQLIDIDEVIDKGGKKSKEKKAREEEDERLKELEKRRQEMLKEEVPE